MERVNRVIDRVVNTQDSKKIFKWTETNKITWICEICGVSIFETRVENNEIEEFFIPISEKVNPVMFKNREIFNTYKTICSKNCYNESIIRKNQKIYDEKLLGLPLKFRGIECDQKLVGSHIGSNLFITGKSGAGKSVLAAGIIKECIKKNKEFQWLSYPAFIMGLQAKYKDNNDRPFEIAEKVARFNGILVIDDLGANKATEWVRQITYFIVNEREQNVLPIIITSNFSLEEIADQIDSRISSRIAGMCKLIKLNGQDRRLESKDKEWTN